MPAEKLWADLLPQPGFARGLLRLMSDRLRHTLERQGALEQVRKELRLAAEIQSSMLSRAGSLFPERPEVDCAAAMDPAAEVGGDFHDAFFVDERHLFFAVGDVAGKGVAAALFMARALTLLRAEALRRPPLPELLARVNEALAEGNEQATFVGLSCGVFDTWSGALRYANGGGGAPFVRCGGRWSRLPMPRGIVIGAMPGFGRPRAARSRRRDRPLQRRRHRGSQRHRRALRPCPARSRPRAYGERRRRRARRVDPRGGAQLRRKRPTRGRPHASRGGAMRSSRPVLLAATLASAAPLGAQSGGGASAATAPQAEPRRGSLRSGRSPSGARRPGPGLSESGARPYREEIETLLLVSERERWPADHSATEFARNDFNAERSGDAFLVPAPAC